MKLSNSIRKDSNSKFSFAAIKGEQTKSANNKTTRFMAVAPLILLNKHVPQKFHHVYSRAVDLIDLTQHVIWRLQCQHVFVQCNALLHAYHHWLWLFWLNATYQ